jgi:hypothetical protein
VDYRITPDDRTRFKRCRRQWDFASPHRRDLEPGEVLDSSAALAEALKDALAVYYYPGTWDWQHALKQSLVQKALRRSLEDSGEVDEIATGAALLDCYDAWATIVDDFAPVKIQHEVQALVPDPHEPDRGLLTRNGSAVTYTCQVDLLAVDASDEYWVVRHQIVDDWQAVETMVLDDEVVAACWAWEQDYISMQIAGTIHNEVRIDTPLDLLPPENAAANASRSVVAQHEPSGGGRSIPQHVRVRARVSPRDDVGRVEQQGAGLLRRTRIRRTRDEIAAAGTLIAAEALDMTRDPATYPSPGAHCLACEFTGPCLAVVEGSDPEPVLAAHFRRRPAEDRPKPRLGQATWGFGRGAAPPEW